MRRDHVGTLRLRALDRRGGFSFGLIHRHPTDSFGAHVGCGRGAFFGRCRSHRDRTRSFLRGRSTVGRTEPDKAETPCLPLTFGSGTPKRLARKAKRPACLGGAKRAAASGNESIQSPREHRAGAQRKRRALATDSSTEESPEVGELSSAPWRHGSEHGSKRREGTPAGERDRVRKDDAR